MITGEATVSARKTAIASARAGALSALIGVIAFLPLPLDAAIEHDGSRSSGGTFVAGRNFSPIVAADDEDTFEAMGAAFPLMAENGSQPSGGQSGKNDTGKDAWPRKELGFTERVQDWLARANREFQTTIIRRLSTPAANGDAIVREIEQMRQDEAEAAASGAEEALETAKAKLAAEAEAQHQRDSADAAAKAAEEAKARDAERERLEAARVAEEQRNADEARRLAEEERQREEQLRLAAAEKAAQEKAAQEAAAREATLAREREIAEAEAARKAEEAKQAEAQRAEAERVEAERQAWREAEAARIAGEAKRKAAEEAKRVADEEAARAAAQREAEAKAKEAAERQAAERERLAQAAAEAAEREEEARREVEAKHAAAAEQARAAEAAKAGTSAAAAPGSADRPLVAEKPRAPAMAAQRKSPPDAAGSARKRRHAQARGHRASKRRVVLASRRHVRGPEVKRWVRRARQGRCEAAGRKVFVPGRYTVARGDNLWLIALRHYRTGWFFRRIYLANRRVIRDPDRIYPCERLYLPRR